MALDLFHPAVRAWFADRFGVPTAAQEAAWPRLHAGESVLVAAPTGSGKTLAAFLAAIDDLLRHGEALPDETRVLYVSPLKALSNDVAKNLSQPLAELAARDPAFARVRVAVRSGDTPARERAAHLRRPPHILVTTPESLFVLLASDGGRRLLSTVRTAIVDEIHAVLGSKRGPHLALSLERLEDLARRPVQRIGLSATQKPVEDVARFLMGVERECAIVDLGHRRDMDLAVVLPSSPLEAVCSHEVWEEIYTRIAALVAEHTTTLVFVGTRKLAERISARLAERLGEARVTCHHSSLSKERRLDAETRLKEGRLAALVATASLELGIDIGDVDLVVQIGAVRSIATFLQRVGRSGHAVRGTPKARHFPLTEDELVEAAALMHEVRRGALDRIPAPTAPLDILAQHLVAACAGEIRAQDELFALCRRAWPYRALSRADFERTVALHTQGRHALLHADGVGGTLRGTRRARLVAVTSGGAIPDRADYRVVQDPGALFVGTVDEDFAIESSAGDVFQLGSTSWRVLKIESGVLRVADAQGAPPSLPFWFGEAPARTVELSTAIGAIRERGAGDPAWLRAACGFDSEAADVLARWLAEANEALGAAPTRTCMVLERFFDATGGMQLVLHAPFGGRINRALGLALRKRFCRGFGFELQAAANEEAVLISLSPQHSFALEDVFDYLRPDTARDLLVQALLATPFFKTRWRWNVSRALLVERMRSGTRVAAPLLRMRADDLLAAAFPDAIACGENLPPGDLEIPWDHPLVAQTLTDCLHEVCDVDGFLEVLEGLHSGAIRRVALDRPDPSPYARGILAAAPYAFLDDAPLEERRAQAVQARHLLDRRLAAEVLELDPQAVAAVCAEAWPDPRDREEVHEVLGWMGFVTTAEARASTPDWLPWLSELAAAGRVERARVDGEERWFAVEAPRDELALWRGRLAVLGPVASDDPALALLEAEGTCLRARFAGRAVWCDRRLLARIRQHTIDQRRRAIRAVSASRHAAFLAEWQHVAPSTRLAGPGGLALVLEQLAGFEAPARAWLSAILPARLEPARPATPARLAAVELARQLDDLLLRGEFVWARLWGSGRSAPRATPIAFFRRADAESFALLARGARAAAMPALDSREQAVHDALAQRGASFAADLARATRLLPEQIERALAALASLGLATCDSFAPFVPQRRVGRRPSSASRPLAPAGGRWSLFAGAAAPDATADPAAFAAELLLRRYGVLFRKVLERERIPVTWRDLARELRARELAGTVRGGRFVEGFSGEQFALPEAVAALRREVPPAAPVNLDAGDPLSFRGLAALAPPLAPADR